MPDPPKDAPNGIMLMHVEADVLVHRTGKELARFSRDLEHRDLETLRKATRKAKPKMKLTDMQCDAIIDELGPTVAEEMLRRAMGAAH